MTPFVQQYESAECGAACLAMVLAHHGHHAPLAEVREAVGAGRDGVRALDIVRAARAYGLEPRARRLEPDDLASVPAPAILHWEMNHFVVLERARASGAEVLDPAVGRRRTSNAQLAESFTGVCLEFSTGPRFTRRARSPLDLRALLAPARAARLDLAAIVVASAALAALGLAVPSAAQVIVDDVIGAGQARWLGAVVAGALTLGAAVVALSLLRARLLARVREALDAQAGAHVAAHLFTLPLRFFSLRGAGDLAQRLESARAVQGMLAGHAVALLLDGAFFFVYLALLVVTAPRLGAIAAAGSAANALIALAARPALRAAARERVVHEARAHQQLLQGLLGARALKAAGAEEAAVGRWLRRTTDALNAALREALLEDRAGVAFAAIGAGVSAAALVVGGRMVIDGRLTLGELAGATFLLGATLAALEGAVTTLLSLRALPLHAERVGDVLRTIPEPAGPHAAPLLDGAVSLVGVSYAYARGAEPALRDVSLEIRAGEKVALVGPSGGGKSTLVHLLLGFDRPNAGQVFYQGVDLATLDPASVRRQIGAVLQSASVFEGTVRENIALSHPAATLDEVVAAARAAHVHDEIAALALGYDTPLSAAQGPLSAGQRQRVVLARALLHRPALLVLDEATSAVDAATEAAVAQVVASRRCTRLIVTHRLATARDADRIVVLDRGAIVACGRHDELVAAGGLYARLVAASERAPADPLREAAADRVRPEALAAFPALADLDPAAAAALAARLARRRHPAGALLHAPGELDAGLYLVESGALDVVLEEPGLSPFRAAVVPAGGVAGEFALLDGAPASASLVVARAGAASVLHLARADFAALDRSGDPSAARLVLALGALVAARGAAVVARLPAPAGPPDATRQPAVALEDTDLGAALTIDERAALRAFAAPRRFEAGEGPAAREAALLLEGALTSAREAFGPGAWAAAEAAFGAQGPPLKSAGAAYAIVVEGDALRARAAAGCPAARKVLGALARSLVARARLRTLELRETVARARREHELALAARESAVGARRVGAAPDGAPPFVPESDADRSALACLASLVAPPGEPAPYAAVADAGGAADGALAALERAARAYGFGCDVRRPPPGDVAYLDGPAVVSLAAGGFALATPDAGGFALMEPRRGRRRVTAPELARAFGGVAVVLRAVDGRATLGARVGAALWEARGAIASLAAATLLMQAMAPIAPAVTALVVDVAVPSGAAALVDLAALALAGATALAVVVGLERRGAARTLRFRVEASLTAQLLRHVLQLPVGFFAAHPPGDLLRRFGALAAVRGLVTSQGQAAIVDAPALAVSAAYVATLDGRFVTPLALAALAHAAAFAAAAPALVTRGLALRRTAAQQHGRLVESIMGVAALRAVGDPSLALTRWLPSYLGEVRAAARFDVLNASLTAGLQGLRHAASIAVLGLGAEAVVAGRLGIGGMMAAASAAGAFLASLDALTRHAGAGVLVRAAAREAAETFAEAPEPNAGGGMAPCRLRGRITLERVTFAYAPGAEPSLADVSLEVPAGAKVAIVGASGSGKSTLVHLLAGLLTPASGRVLYDGRDLRGLDLRAVRRQLGVVLQDTFVFTGTLRENITLGAPGVAPEAVVDAARRAALHDVIDALPMRYETIVSEGGATLSAGQRQRLALARALLHRPAVLLLDEATSAVDELTQAAIEEALAEVACTRVVIAHRLATVTDAELIVVLDRGRVVELGRHDALLAARGRYHALVTAQRSGHGRPATAPT